MRSEAAAALPEYSALGLTDAAILGLLENDVTLLTADWGLYTGAMSRANEAAYFADLRGGRT